MMRTPVRSPMRYAVAALAVTAAVGAIRLPVVGSGMFFLLFLAVLVAAWYGGLGPGLLATSLVVVASIVFRLATGAGFDPPQIAALVVFPTVSVLVTLLVEALHASRRRAEETGRWLSAVLTSIGDAVIATDAEGRVTFANSVAGALTGWLPDQMASRPLDEVLRLVSEPTRKPVESPVGRVLRDGLALELGNHVLLIARDGSERPIADSAAPIRDGREEIQGVVLVFRDVAERRQREAELRESEERFQRFMQHLPGLAWIKDPDGRYVFANDAAEGAFQTRREDLYGRTDNEVFPPETAAQFRENDRRAMAGESGLQTVEELAHDDGTVHYSLVNKFPIPGPDGRPALVGGVAIDITERRRAEEALRESEERFRLSLGSGAVTVFEQDLDLRYTWVYPQDPAFPEQNIGRTDAELVPTADGEELMRLKREVLETGRAMRRTIHVEIPGGERYYDLVIEPRTTRPVGSSASAARPWMSRPASKWRRRSRSPTAARTSSWRCSPTSCATRSRPSATRVELACQAGAGSRAGPRACHRAPGPAPRPA